MGLVDLKFYPYVGMTRIRLEGIISARTIGHPLNCGCKVTHILPPHQTYRQKKMIRLCCFTKNSYLCNP